MQALKGKGKGGKERGDWGEKERDTCLKNPLLFISAAACVHKFLIGWVVMSNLLTLLVRNFHDWVWYENDQYPFFMLWMGDGGWGRGGGLWEYKGGSKPFTCHSLHSRFLLPFFLGLLPLALSWLQNIKHFLHNFPPFPSLPTYSEFPLPPFHFLPPVDILPGSHLLSFLT